MKILLDKQQLDITLQRLAHQLAENHTDFSDTVLVGLQPRGIFFSDRIVHMLQKISPAANIRYGKLDITFYRDDLHKEAALQEPAQTDLGFGIEGKRVVLIDDVLHTGRTVRAAMDALIDFGRPKSVELMVLIDRRFSRELPIRPDYTGRSVDTLAAQKVLVRWKENHKEDRVELM